MRSTQDLLSEIAISQLFSQLTVIGETCLDQSNENQRGLFSCLQVLKIFSGYHRKKYERPTKRKNTLCRRMYI